MGQRVSAGRRVREEPWLGAGSTVSGGSDVLPAAGAGILPW
jgi:hypothetical protein